MEEERAHSSRNVTGLDTRTGCPLRVTEPLKVSHSQHQSNIEGLRLYKLQTKVYSLILTLKDLQPFLRRLTFREKKEINEQVLVQRGSLELGSSFREKKNKTAQ